jgi:large subunit ribosomal protein L44e
MRKPKKIKRYCPYCDKHTEHKVTNVSSGHKRGTMKRGAIERAKLRGRGRGYGNLGKYGSKPAVTKFKRKTKSTKKTNFMYTCAVCKKSHCQKKGKRSGKIQVGDGEKEKAKW